MREYAIYCYKYGGGYKVNAFLTFGKFWPELRALLPPNVCQYARVPAINKFHALWLARSRWLK